MITSNDSNDKKENDIDRPGIRKKSYSLGYDKMKESVLLRGDKSSKNYDNLHFLRGASLNRAKKGIQKGLRPIYSNRPSIQRLRSLNQSELFKKYSPNISLCHNRSQRGGGGQVLQESLPSKTEKSKNSLFSTIKFNTLSTQNQQQNKKRDKNQLNSTHKTISKSYRESNKITTLSHLKNVVIQQQKSGLVIIPSSTFHSSSIVPHGSEKNSGGPQLQQQQQYQQQNNSHFRSSSYSHTRKRGVRGAQRRPLLKKMRNPPKNMNNFSTLNNKARITHSYTTSDIIKHASRDNQVLAKLRKREFDSEVKNLMQNDPEIAKSTSKRGSLRSIKNRITLKQKIKMASLKIKLSSFSRFNILRGSFIKETKDQDSPIHKSTDPLLCQSLSNLFIQLKIVQKQFDYLKPTTTFYQSRAKLKFFSSYSPSQLKKMAYLFMVQRGEYSENNKPVYKTPPEVSNATLANSMFKKGLYTLKEAFEGCLKTYLEEINKAGSSSKKMQEAITKLVRDPHIQLDKLKFEACKNMITFFEEISVEYKYFLFGSITENTRDLIEDIKNKSNNLVQVTNPSLVKEYELSKVNKTSTSQFVYMMKSMLSGKRRRMPIKNLVEYAELVDGVSQQSKGKGKQDLLGYNEELNKIFGSLERQFK